VGWSNYLLAVYNGEQRGGTAATVRYAKIWDERLFLLIPSLGVQHMWEIHRNQCKPDRSCQAADFGMVVYKILEFYHPQSLHMPQMRDIIIKNGGGYL